MMSVDANLQINALVVKGSRLAGEDNEEGFLMSRDFDKGRFDEASPDFGTPCLRGPSMTGRQPEALGQGETSALHPPYRTSTPRPAILSPPRSEQPKPTAGVLNLLDPRQPSEAEIHASAQALIEQFGGDVGAAGLWLVDEAIRLQAIGDRQRNLVAVRMARALRAQASR